MRYFLLLLALSCGTPPSTDCNKTGCPSGKTCNPNTGACLASGAGGGGGKVDGGPSCGTCAGCCDGSVCRVGTASSACGSSSAACVACTNNQTCQAGACKLTCDKTTCPSGCCGGGECKPGTAFEACGKGGETCTACASNLACWSATGACVFVLTVEIRYRYSGAMCSTLTCSKSKEMTQSQYDALQPDYAACTFTEPSASTRVIDCTGLNPCVLPKSTTATCSWTP